MEASLLVQTVVYSERGRRQLKEHAVSVDWKSIGRSGRGGVERPRARETWAFFAVATLELSLIYPRETAIINYMSIV